MSIFVKGGRAAKALSKLKKKTLLPTAVIGTGAIVGATSFADNAQPGLKKPAAFEGAVFGALGAASLVLAPKIGRAMGRSGVKKAKRAARKGKVVFRRIRGRIIPIRKK